MLLNGYPSTSVDEITATAEVAKGTFYVHFQRKQDVLLEWAAELMEDIDITTLPDDAPVALRELGQRLAAAMMEAQREILNEEEAYDEYTCYDRSTATMESCDEAFEESASEDKATYEEDFTNYTYERAMSY